MRQSCLLLFCHFLFCTSLHSQETINKITQTYFRSDPFKGEFSQFVNGLINDPNLSQKKMDKKTDSTLFYLQGTYSSHSPFFFPTIVSKIVLAEQQEYIDTASKDIYTYYIYQLIAYANTGEEGYKDVTKEFDKLNRRFKKVVKTTELRELKTDNQKKGEIMNYSMKELPFYPLSVAWSSSTDNNNNLLVISIRFLLIGNKAFLPKSSDSP